ncbi:hypothetical protein EDEG_02978 [Edhazardia aedis USNM 41457]|uniref:DUF8032 domain-containing protein n=1 Tax=Edhazardia aedis (strain USNM 41457) TaxID=1003232 RepID=J9DJ48_EDHAE|nr:hypothetical protein EDEG_02978 [Edhazardia aedis USNM 41457]|eukprot:EJW02620.1 hypothetical protein EDEG_02978 [Edhazardia aedis USNM 41457]
MNDDMSSDTYILHNENVPNVNKPKRRERRRRGEEKKKPQSTRKIVNFPASAPYIKWVDGEERLCFKYNTKISESALSTMASSNQLGEYEFCVRFDLDSVDINRLSEKFKADNCIYPRANCEKDVYKGNRWLYETECNRLAWQFVSLNPVLLYGKKGLIQRAVDTYRNNMKETLKNRLQEERLVNGVMRRRSNEPNNTGVIYYTVRGTIRKVRIRIDIDSVNYDLIDDEFKTKYSVFPEEFTDEDFGKVKYEYKNPDNELAVKLAHLNIENTSFWNGVKYTDKSSMLRKAVEAYKDNTTPIESSTEDKEFSKIVGETFKSAHDNKLEPEENFYFLDQRNE